MRAKMSIFVEVCSIGQLAAEGFLDIIETRNLSCFLFEGFRNACIGIQIRQVESHSAVTPSGIRHRDSCQEFSCGDKITCCDRPPVLTSH